MAMTCRVCPHPKRFEIEKAFLELTPLKTIAHIYGISRHLTIGCDLGKRNDFTALSVLERIGEGASAQFHLLYLKRIERGITYEKVENHIIDFYNKVAELGTTELVVDRGGVGDSVIDSLRAKGYSVIGFLATSGERITEVKERNGVEIHAPKAKLVMGLAVALETTGQFLISKALTYGAVFRAELARMTYRRTATGGIIFGNEGGSHDDLVSSTAMAYWQAKKSKPKPEVRLRWI